MAEQSRRGSGRFGSIASESNAIFELAALLRDRIYSAPAAAPGAGRMALVVPGLFGNDLYLWPLRRWLSRIGFRAGVSGLWLNAGCPDRLTRDILDRVARRGDSGKLVLIGHSRGGMLAHALASQIGSRVSHLVMLGSPIGTAMEVARSGWTDERLREGMMTPLARASNTARRILDPRCDFPQCGCAYVTAMLEPLPSATSVLSIYSNEDPVVSPQACVVPGARNVAVAGTHSGLVYNPAAYRALLDFLSFNPRNLETVRSGRVAVGRS